MSVSKIKFLADKVVIHHWPKDTPVWSDERKKQIEQHFGNKDKKQIIVSEKTIRVDDLEFGSLKKVGINVPLFDRQFTMIFEGHCQEFDAHVHITCKATDFLVPFNQIMVWRDSNIQA